MKKTFYLSIIAVCIVITIVATVVACSADKDSFPLSDYLEAMGTLSTESIEIPTHNASREESEDLFFSESSESEETTEESIDTSNVGEDEIEDTSSREVETFVEETDSETETETETESEIKVLENLEFTSFGNGTCAVVGIGNLTDTHVIIPERSPEGDVVTAIYTEAFCGNESIRAVEIPSTVSFIGERAFSACAQLVYISVDDANIFYTDESGALYSKDMTEMLCFPSANGASCITLPSSLTRIADMAFYSCDNLKTIYYSGSIEDWKCISIGEMNYGLFTAAVVFGSEG